MCHDTEEWGKIWRKIDLWLGKSHEEYGKLLPKHSKTSKVGIWWDHVIQNRKCMSYVLWVIKMKNDEKREEELTCPINIVMRNLTNFDPSTRNSQKFAL